MNHMPGYLSVETSKEVSRLKLLLLLDNTIFREFYLDICVNF